MAIIIDTAHPWWDIPYWAGQLMDKGGRMYDNYVGLATEPVPDDALGKVDYGIRMITQVGISKLMEGAGMAAFLLEEGVQAIGMGAFLLYQSKDYETLDTYMDTYDNLLGMAEAGIVGLAATNPLVGGAVMQYLVSARAGYEGLRKAVDHKLAETETRLQYISDMMDPLAGWGTLRLKSSPSLAEIWIDGKNTELLTPETFKEIAVGTYAIELRRFSTRREVWDIFSFDVTIEPGRIKETHVRIPPTITSEDEIKEQATHGILRIQSTPSAAEIWIDDVNTNTLTPESFKEITPGEHDITLKSFSRKLGVWDEYTFTVTIVKGEKLELKVNIPGKAYDYILSSIAIDETETPRVQEFVKATATGDIAKDGDTFTTTTGEVIRLLAIDAPETGQPYSQEAEAFLDNLIDNKSLELKIQSHKPLDAHGRTLALVRTYKGDLSELILMAGLARLNVFDDDTYDPNRYKAAEDVAQERRVGIWATLS